MAQLNYKHLRYFRAVAHDGNLTQAARALNLSQSALSIQIKKLEAQLGHKLFDRHGGRLHLTEVGRITLDHADAIFAVGDELLSTLTGGQQGGAVIRIGALATLSRNFQIGLIRKVLSEPDVSLTLRSGSLETLLQDLADLSLDVVIVNALGSDDQVSGFHFHKLAEQQISLIGTPERIGKGRNIAEILTDQPIILPHSGGSIRIGFDALVQNLGVRPKIVAEADDMAMMRLLARENIGVAVLPPVVVRDELSSGQLVEAHPLPDVVETFFAVTADRQFPNPLLKVLLS